MLETLLTEAKAVAERRRHTRHQCEIRGSISSGGAADIATKIISISYDGFRITSDSEKFLTILPEANDNNRAIHRFLRLCFTLPSREPPFQAPVEVTAQVAHVTQYNSDLHIGMKLHDIECGIEEFTEFLLELED